MSLMRGPKEMLRDLEEKTSLGFGPVLATRAGLLAGIEIGGDKPLSPIGRQNMRVRRSTLVANEWRVVLNELFTCWSPIPSAALLIGG